MKKQTLQKRQQIFKSAATLRKNKQEDKSVMMGVGDGTGNLFVHGSHEAITVLRDKLIELEKIRQHELDKEEVMAMFDRLKVKTITIEQVHKLLK